VREQAQREEMRVQDRLRELERTEDRRAADVRQAQERFALAMDQVSQMQTRLLDSEERRRELETAIDVIQLSLRDMRHDRDMVSAELATLQSELQAETGTVQTAAARERELARTLGYLTEALRRPRRSATKAAS
jgi:chromosome segregation ATPase